LERCQDRSGVENVLGITQMPCTLQPCTRELDTFKAEGRKHVFSIVRYPRRCGLLFADELPAQKTVTDHAGVTVAKDGSIFVTDDGSRSVGHVSYIGK
jgi:hypothetical protein